MNLKNLLIILGALALLGGCAQKQPTPAQPTNHPYTQGQVSLTMKKGVTTQEQVAEAFGAPNIVTQDSSGNQVWIYQKDNVTVKSGGTSGYFTILIAGVSGGSSNYQQSSRTMTLTIHFDKNGVVKDFKSMSTSF
ncbi:MAG: outer membrane protein assembly factor BamE [Gammaproteobacteria bacterium]|nr:outer membrane protein assembly factor BamE [Gammaproteobacteria bacterium]